MGQKISENLLYHRELTREEEIALKNKRSGILVFQISWIMAFIALVVVNLQLRSNAPTWPPPGVQPLDPVLPAVATLALLVSAVTARGAVNAVRHDLLPRMQGMLRLTLVLGAVFIGIMVYEWFTLPPVPTELLSLPNGEEVIAPVSQFNAVFRVMTAFHGAHALVIALYVALFVLRRAAQGAYSLNDYWDVEAGAKLWYFVVIAWIIFYVVLYWI
jgi:cytochrome c oxidase subunit 3